MALILDGVTFAYAAGTPYEHVALADVTFRADEATLTLVIGPSGSGKSTLLLLAAGLLEPTAGLVTVGGPAPGRARGVAIGQVGIVFQRPESQLFAETVLADVAFGPRNLGMSESEATSAARSALSDVGMDADAFGPRSPFSLSGGEARRVAIAGVLAMRPPYLLLDEPTAGLDAAGRDAVLSSLELVRGTAGVVVVSHDPEDLAPVSDRIVALEAGRVVFSGRPDTYLASADELDLRGIALPEVVRAQVVAARAGAVLATPVFDPDRAGEALARAARVAP